MGERLKMLALAILTGGLIALLMICFKGTAFGRFLEAKISIIFIVIAVVFVALSELGRKRAK